MKSLDDAACLAETQARIRALSPDARRRWGRMTVGQMVCHLDDSYRGVMGERPSRDISTPFSRTIVRLIALRLPVPWPKGVPTMPEVDAEKGGTPPAEFASDRARLEQSLEAFTAAAREGRCAGHPLFGRMSRGDWLRWGYLHADHHLRQFGA